MRTLPAWALLLVAGCAPCTECAKRDAEPRAVAGPTYRVDLAPRKRLEGRITAVSQQYRLVIVNIGKDQGVLAGDEFTIYRDRSFVAKITIERVDRRWGSGRILFGTSDPRIADFVTNDIRMSPNSAAH